MIEVESLGENETSLLTNGIESLCLWQLLAKAEESWAANAVRLS